jgi:hypothetical protein
LLLLLLLLLLPLLLPLLLLLLLLAPSPLLLLLLLLLSLLLLLLLLLPSTSTICATCHALRPCKLPFVAPARRNASCRRQQQLREVGQAVGCVCIILQQPCILPTCCC